MLHSASQSIHLAMYIQSADPGAVGAKVMWLDTTSGSTLETGALLKKRNAGNTGWDTVFGGGGGVALTDAVTKSLWAIHYT